LKGLLKQYFFDHTALPLTDFHHEKPFAYLFSLQHYLFILSYFT
jgi:hypothetical protein